MIVNPPGLAAGLTVSSVGFVGWVADDDAQQVGFPSEWFRETIVAQKLRENWGALLPFSVAERPSMVFYMLPLVANHENSMLGCELVGETSSDL